MTVRSIVVSFIRGASKASRQHQGDIGREAVVDLIQQSAAKQSGIRKGWEVKAATWVKRVHVDRGDVKVGRLGTSGEFQVLPHLRPRYFVPADLDTFQLKPYVEVDKKTDAVKH
ncbi:hypothetical protein HYH02_009559 [Chlamydomonas schloesseri]|uniref:Uncharacterized protein n=1 Tax=Chlamydomonas schloesseri TaxID=2026947 RepID=A0A835TGL8_9CHLO|nr:hypothetical protein HYH02_009559 [Chlamydomonas schloesseri]|eukprot:KAG2443148.1 hypothetical protein HYH02_009559 [Chlamydomonas schloesseri]